MSILPSQKLTIGELFVSIAAGLMIFLLPNDAGRQIESNSLAESLVFIYSVIITLVLMFIIKRYQAVGAAILSMAVFTVTSFFIEMVRGIFTKGADYWPTFDEYRLITMFIMWTAPFFVIVTIRLFTGGSKDNNESRRGFSRFLSMSIKALMIIYILVIVFKMLIPQKPNMTSERQMDLILFSRISACIMGTHENGIMYIMWHSLILAPLTFSISILNPKIKMWHLLVIAAATGFTIEMIQYSLNTSTACLDDLIMYIIGAAAGICIKRFIDFLRRLFTAGSDKCMLSFSYTPLPPKQSNTVTVLTED